MKTPDEYFRTKTKEEILRMPPEAIFFIFDRDTKDYSFQKKRNLFVFLRSYAVAIAEGFEKPGENTPELIKNGVQIYTVKSASYQNYRKIRCKMKKKPTQKILRSLPRGWEEKFEEYGNKLESVSALILALGISKNDFYNLLHEEPKFQSAYEKYDLCYTAELERCGVRQILKGNGRTFEAFSFNKLGWSNKYHAVTEQKVEVKKPEEMTDQELKEALEAQGLPTSIFRKKE